MVSRNSLISRGVRKRSNLIIAFLLFFLIGCAPASPAGTVAPPPEATPTLEPPTPAPDYAAQIRNAQYQLGFPDSLRVVQLTDGKYETGAPGGADYVVVTVMGFAARGNIDGDSPDEIVALVAENYGGTGVFVFLTVYEQVDAELVFRTSALVDDRPIVNALSIENGEIFLDATTHGFEDPGCCPTLRNERHYRLINNQLQLTDYVTFTPDGRPRTITIESPANGSEVFSSVQVKGSVAIAPFENTLAFRIYDVGGVELSAGAFTMTTPDLGAPGTFDTTINLGGLLSGSVIRIEIQDISAKDGSLLAMDSVELVVK
jgi:hypothetical protein